MQPSVRELFDHYTVVPPAHYQGTLELAAEVHKVPGAIVECGVWRGGMIAGIAMALGPRRQYVLCDSFEGLPDPSAQDGPSAHEWFLREGRMDNAPESYAMEAMAKAGVPPTNYTIAKGWFEDTLPHLKFPDGIALLRLDADFYDATYDALWSLYPQVNEGGIVIVDDYYFLDGAAKAVHDYVSMFGEDSPVPRIETHGDWRRDDGVAFIRPHRRWT